MREFLKNSYAARMGLWACLALGFVLYLILLVQYVNRSPFARTPMIDSEYYWTMALATGERGEPFPAMIFSAPLYPLLLSLYVAVFSNHLQGVYAIQLALNLAAMVLIYKTGSRIFSPSKGLLAGLMLVFYSPFAFHATKILPDTLGLFLLSAYLFIFTHPRWSRTIRGNVALGCVAGAGVLTRPQILLVVFVTMAASIWWHDESEKLGQTCRRITLVAVACGAAIFPWSLYVFHQTGRMSFLSPNAGLSFFEGNNPRARGTYAQVLPDSAVIENRMEQMQGHASAALKRKVSVLEADRYFFAQAKDYIRKNPLDWVKLEALKAFLIMRPSETHDIYDMYMERQKFLPVLYIFFLQWGLVFPLCLIGLYDALVASRKTLLKAVLPLLLSAAFIIIFMMVFFVNARYRLLLLPMAVLFASHGAFVLAGWFGNRRVWAGLAGAALVLLGVAASYVPSRVFNSSSEAMAGKSLAMAGRYEEAEMVFSNLLQRDPGPAENQHNLFLVLLWQGKLNQAAPLLKKLENNHAYAQSATYYNQIMAQARQRFNASPYQDIVVPTPAYRRFLDEAANAFAATQGKGVTSTARDIPPRAPAAAP